MTAHQLGENSKRMQASSEDCRAQVKSDTEISEGESKSSMVFSPSGLIKPNSEKGGLEEHTISLKQSKVRKDEKVELSSDVLRDEVPQKYRNSPKGPEFDDLSTSGTSTNAKRRLNTTPTNRQGSIGDPPQQSPSHPQLYSLPPSFI